VALALSLVGFSQEPAPKETGPKGPVEVKIQDEKPVVAEAMAAVDPQQHVQLFGQGNMFIQLRVNNQNLHIGVIQTNFHVDGMVLFPGNPPGRLLNQNQPLPKGKSKRARQGFSSVYEIGKLTITQEVEVVPTRAKPGQKRRLDAAMVRYIVDNKDDRPHKVGVRVFMNPFILNNRGSLFAAPTQPNKILDGVELKDKQVPNYLQLLQRPDLKNPGFVAHMTYNFGRNFAMPDRVILTGPAAFINQWDMRVMPAMGISALGFYWDPKDVKARSKRSLAYSFGEGIASTPEGDGQMALSLGGSFEPGKLFTVTAYVVDPAPGQFLTLELPDGMKHVEGKLRQSVPEADDEGNTMVLWKARVLKTGRFTLRVRSSTGVTQTKIISITRPGEKTTGG
jgi:hypothetical protein